MRLRSLALSATLAACVGSAAMPSVDVDAIDSAPMPYLPASCIPDGEMLDATVIGLTNVPPGVEHSPLPATAEAEWMGWIDWRFAGGRYADGKCSRVTRRAPFGGNWTKTPPEFRLPKFLGGGGGGNKSSTADEL